MILLDVNVLVYAHRADLLQHPLAAGFLDRLVNGTQTFGVPEMGFASLVRIVTQSAFKPPSTVGTALDFCNAVMSSPSCLVLQPSERHWRIFADLCRFSSAVKGKHVADAYLAAFAIDRGDECVTFDHDFARFRGLRWRLLK